MYSYDNVIFADVFDCVVVFVVAIAFVVDVHIMFVIPPVLLSSMSSCVLLLLFVLGACYYLIVCIVDGFVAVVYFGVADIVVRVFFSVVVVAVCIMLSNAVCADVTFAVDVVGSYAV